MDTGQDPVTPTKRKDSSSGSGKQHHCLQSDISCTLCVPVPLSFSLEKAVVSYGFFMMAPNQWFPPKKATPTAMDSLSLEDGGGGEETGEEDDWGLVAGGMLQRPLRLANGRAAMVQISEGARSLGGDGRHQGPECVLVRVLGVQALEDEDRLSLQAQVSRMLRLKESDAEAVRAFQAAHPEASQEQFGRLFRSPTLFEDMIKTMLLCNCGWGRTLSMNQRLCEIQAQLHGPPLGHPPLLNRSSDSGEPSTAPKTPIPSTPPQSAPPPFPQCPSGNTPPPKQPVRELAPSFTGPADPNADVSEGGGRAESASEEGKAGGGGRKGCRGTVGTGKGRQRPVSGSGGEGRELRAVGAFPTAGELAVLDPAWLSAACGLGYRAARVVGLAVRVSSGAVDLRMFEGCGQVPRPPAEDLMAEALKLPGFGPFAAANVMCCLGEFRVIAADSETARHVRQVHGRADCSISNVDKVVAQVYNSHAPFQFLAYWFEIWRSYEERFGSLSRLPPSDYRLLTGHNMKQKGSSEDLALKKTSDDHPKEPRTPRKRTSSTEKDTKVGKIRKRAKGLERCTAVLSEGTREGRIEVEQCESVFFAGELDVISVKLNECGEGGAHEGEDGGELLKGRTVAVSEANAGTIAGRTRSRKRRK